MPGIDRRSAPPAPATYTRRRIVVGAATVGLPAAVLWRAGLRGRPAADTAPSPASTGPPATAPEATPAPLPDSAPTTDVAAPAIGNEVRPGMVGDDVRLLQQRLIDLRFDPRPVDGVFGPATTRAVY